jgi:hypothetical protein
MVPVLEPIMVPVREPIMVPVLEPIMVPVREPIMVPVLEPIMVPVLEPIMVPVRELAKDVAVKTKVMNVAKEILLRVMLNSPNVNDSLGPFIRSVLKWHAIMKVKGRCQ